jgi:5-methylcytosine-specific restriction endonuclease McrA
MARDHARLYVVTGGGNQRRANKPHKALFRRVRREVFIRDAFTCQVCGLTYPGDESYDGTFAPWPVDDCGPLTLDHITPYAEGGEFVARNLRAACEHCNTSRGSRPIEVEA